MKQKYVHIFHNNVKTSRKNAMFDSQNNPMTEASIYKRLKNFLKQKNVHINTYDIPLKCSSYRNIHYDLPYPIPSNYPVWKQIVLNKKKNILICTEPPTVNPFNYIKTFHRFFLKVYTWNAALVDDKKYFQYKLPKSSAGITTRARKFKDKKFLTLINSNKSPFYPFILLSPFGRELYSKRIQAIEFLETKIPDKFFLYGRGWNKPKKYSLMDRIVGYKHYITYQGEIDNKIEVLSGFKYCICFENLTHVKGFITEKIFDCFKARCVPIYWGATDVEHNIPKQCFIDFRDFYDYERLLAYLDSIDESAYNHYIENIERLLGDKSAMEPWFEEGYAKFFLDDVLEMKKKLRFNKNKK